MMMRLPTKIDQLGIYCEKYYEKYGKRYFWRKIPLNPFQILLLEFFLWKTRAEIIEKYGKFIILKFDDPSKILILSDQDLFNLLKPFGLYKRRTKLLKKLSYIILNKFNGNVPKNLNLLIKLPGVGPYVATSTLLFAFDEPYVPIDLNVEFFLKKYFNIKFSIKSRLYIFSNDYLNFSRIFFSQVKNRKYAGWGLLDLSKTYTKKL